jgi:hypothetical protein
MKSFSIGLVILSALAFLMVGSVSVPLKPRDEYDELRNVMESCSSETNKDKSEIKMFCEKYPTSSSYCDRYLDNPNFSADHCKNVYDDVYEKCCGGLESRGPRDDVVIPKMPELRTAVECSSGTNTNKSEIKIFCKTYPTSSSYCDQFSYYPLSRKFPNFDAENCIKGFDYVHDKCCGGGLEWWVILLIVMAVVEVIGVIIGLVACRRGKADNGGVGPMNPNYAAGANGPPGNVYGPPGNVVGQTGNAYNQPGKLYGPPAPGKVYGQTQPVGALQHVYKILNSIQLLVHLFTYCTTISSVSQ